MDAAVTAAPRARCRSRRAAQRGEVRQQGQAVRPSGPRRERTGPRPRSIASSSPRWSGIRAATGTEVSRATASGRTPSPRSTSRSGPGSWNRAHSRTADATPATVGTVGTNTRSHRATSSSTSGSTVRGRSTTTVSWPRCAADSASRTANACRLPGGPGVPGQHAEPVAARQRLAQRAAAEPPGRLAQRVPPDAVVVVEAEDPVDARAERVGVDDHGRAGARGQLPERAGERRRAGPAATRRSRRRWSSRRAAASPRSVSSSVTQPDGPGQLGDVLGAQRERGPEHVVGRRRPTPRRGPRRAGAARRGRRPRARSTPTSTSGAALQAPQRAPTRRGRPSGVTPAAAASRWQLVEEGLVAW